MKLAKEVDTPQYIDQPMEDMEWKTVDVIPKSNISIALPTARELAHKTTAARQRSSQSSLIVTSPVT